MMGQYQGMADTVKGLMDPVYQGVGKALPYIILAILIFFLLRRFKKLGKKLKVRKIRNLQPESTNNWFSWDKYNEWKKENQQKYKTKR